MTLEERIRAFVQLGERIKDLPGDVRQQWYGRAGMHNNWFTPDNVQLALDTIAGYLREEELLQWVQSYAFENAPPRKVGVLMAGNVPAASFHDMLCVLVSGHRLLARLHAQDPFLPGALTGLLTKWNRHLPGRWCLPNGSMKRMPSSPRATRRSAGICNNTWAESRT
jgi:hypothetical protein